MDNKNIEVVVDNVEEEVKEDIMTVAEFVELYENDKTKDKTEVVKKLKITPYIDYEMKISLADNIIKNSNVDKETGNIVLNSPLRFIFFVYTIINKYTNVRMGAGDMLGDFNALNSRGLVEYLMKQVPEKELSEFTTVVDMVCNDLITNKTEIHAFVNEVLNALAELMGAFSNIGEQFKDVDFEKVLSQLEEAASKTDR